MRCVGVEVAMLVFSYVSVERAGTSPCVMNLSLHLYEIMVRVCATGKRIAFSKHTMLIDPPCVC